uniref:Methyltransferase FkbM domain-containing protein n=1 Tax=viral metagenome TaxID=1070528 RepID=A0A6C0LDJ0_9ZZZZ
MFYSQYKQDEYLETTIFKGYKNGFYVDVGAHDGVSLNNTLYFETNNNWHGINIEPIKGVFDTLVKNRPDDVNINCAVCNRDGEADFFLNEGYTEMLSGIIENYDARHLERLMNENTEKSATTQIVKVNTKRLETIFDEHAVSHINYLSIDVEGAEFDVIKSINFDKVFIDVIGFENNYTEVSKPIILYLEYKGFKVDKISTDIFMINRRSKFCKTFSHLTYKE